MPIHSEAWSFYLELVSDFQSDMYFWRYDRPKCEIYPLFGPFSSFSPFFLPFFHSLARPVFTSGNPGGCLVVISRRRPVGPLHSWGGASTGAYSFLCSIDGRHVQGLPLPFLSPCFLSPRRIKIYRPIIRRRKKPRLRARELSLDGLLFLG